MKFRKEVGMGCRRGFPTVARHIAHPLRLVCSQPTSLKPRPPGLFDAHLPSANMKAASKCAKAAQDIVVYAQNFGPAIARSIPTACCDFRDEPVCGIHNPKQLHLPPAHAIDTMHMVYIYNSGQRVGRGL